MTPVIEGLAALGGETSDPAPAPSGEPVDPAQVTALVESIATLLEDMDPDAEERVGELAALLRGQVKSKLLKRLARHAAAFEFEEASAVLAELRKSLEEEN
jgi:two-component system sensor histidine kinase/response regulator